MEMQVLESEARDGDALSQELTFSWLYQKVQGYAAQSIYPKASRLESGSFWLALVATGTGLLAAAIPGHVVPVLWIIYLQIACLFVEIAGFLTAFALMLRREWRQYAKPRLTQADEMDNEFHHWLSLVLQLRKFPRVQREQRLRYVSNLRQNMLDRMGLLYGGLQKLGPFPLIVGLYLQFRSWRWGDWAGAFDVNLVAGLLIFLMTLLYVLGWVMISMRIRLDTYVGLLEASLKEDEPQK